MSITVDVAGTYEFNININCLTNGYISAILYNSTTSTEVGNSFFQIVNVNLITGSIGLNGFKSLIIENITAGTIYKVRALKTSAASGTGTVYNNATNGYSYINFKMLGLTTNVPLNTKWTSKASSAGNFTMTFGTNNIYSLINDNTNQLIYLNCSQTISFISSGFTTISGSLTSNFVNNGSISSNARVQITANTLYYKAQKALGDIYDTTNNNHFRYTVIYIADGTPYMCVEQLF
jgi:hypothetical protein